MKKHLLLGLVLALGMSLAQAQRHRYSVFVGNSDDPTAGDDCSKHLRGYGYSDYSSILRDESTITLPNQSLSIKAGHNGGVQVTTWDKPEYSIKLCKLVASETQDQGRKVLDETRLVVEGNNLHVVTPDREGDEFSVNTLLIVNAPKGATLSMSAINGGVSLNKFTGTAAASTVNGGISLRQSTGTLTATAVNGGISIQDCGGQVTANVENGGIHLALAERWEGKGLEAHTHNGGLMVSVPSNFNAGLEVSGSNHVTFACRGDVCDSAQKTWDDNRRILRIGGPNPLIRATTINGGIVIQDRSHMRAEM